MGISFCQDSSRTPTKTGISEHKFPVPHAVCSKDGSWKGIPYSEKNQYFWKKTDVSLVIASSNPIYKLFCVL